MTLNVVRISIDRKSGSEIERQVIGHKAVEDKQYQEGCVRFLTGLTVAECYQIINADRKG